MEFMAVTFDLSLSVRAFPTVLMLCPSRSVCSVWSERAASSIGTCLVGMAYAQLAVNASASGGGGGKECRWIYGIGVGWGAGAVASTFARFYAVSWSGQVRSCHVMSSIGFVLFSLGFPASFFFFFFFFALLCPTQRSHRQKRFNSSVLSYFLCEFPLSSLPADAGRCRDRNKRKRRRRN